MIGRSTPRWASLVGALVLLLATWCAPAAIADTAQEGAASEPSQDPATDVGAAVVSVEVSAARGVEISVAGAAEVEATTVYVDPAPPEPTTPATDSAPSDPPPQPDAPLPAPAPEAVAAPAPEAPAVPAPAAAAPAPDPPAVDRAADTGGVGWSKGVRHTGVRTQTAPAAPPATEPPPTPPATEPPPTSSTPAIAPPPPAAGSTDAPSSSQGRTGERRERAAGSRRTRALETVHIAPSPPGHGDGSPGAEAASVGPAGIAVLLVSLLLFLIAGLMLRADRAERRLSSLLWSGHLDRPG